MPPSKKQRVAAANDGASSAASGSGATMSKQASSATASSSRTAASSSGNAAPAYAGGWSRLKLSEPLSPWLREYVESELGFTQMTPVQASAIPLFLSHKDVIVEAITGSGKTLAYLVPIVELLTRKWLRDWDERRAASGAAADDDGEGGADGEVFLSPREQRSRHTIGALVVAPTHELAQQIYGVLERILRAQPAQLDEDRWRADREERIQAKIAMYSGKNKLTRLEAEQAVDEEDAQAAEDGDEESHISVLTGPAPLRAQLVVGGSAVKPQRDYQRLKEDLPDILVGTPGRLEDLLKRPGVDTKGFEMLVMDEADRLLDLGFLPSLTAILGQLPRQRRTGLFSATMTDGMAELARLGLRNPTRIVVKVEKKVLAKDGAVLRKEAVTEDRRIPTTLQNYFLACRPENKLAQLLRLLRYETSAAADEELRPQPSGAGKVIVYFATCAQVNYFHKLLLEAGPSLLPGIQLHTLHGKQTPSRRRATFKAFVSALSVPGLGGGAGSASVLLCTDVAARGLDLPDVDCVVQYDPPVDPSSFNHRIGRTARAGRKGRAVVLLHRGREEEYADFLRVRKVPLQPYPYLLEQVSGSVIPGAEPDGPDTAARDLEAKLRAGVLKDRQLFDLGALAFVSYVRAYGKHEAAYIFRSKELSFAGIARAFALLRLPRMPELKGAAAQPSADGAIAFEDAAVDMDAYAYRDAAKERHRQEALAKRKAAAAEAGDAGLAAQQKRKASDPIDQGSNVAVGEAWSQQKRKKEVRELRREKKERKRKWQKAQAAEAAAAAASASAAGAASATASAAKSQTADQEEEEEDDWDAEEREERRRRKAEKAASSKAVALDEDGGEGGGEQGGFFDGL